MTTRSRALQPFFHPDKTGLPAPEYERFRAVRVRLLEKIRADSDEKRAVLEDLVDALLANDKNIPTDPISSILAVISLGKKVRERKKRRKIYNTIIKEILEQIFDPLLEYKLTRKDILDLFQANGISRDAVANDQIEQIYVRILRKLRVGELRDLTYEEDLHPYLLLKIRDISDSRNDWQMNGR